ncbi:hypothetical protein BFW01_g11958 [Lasiodiplodia theobromae]|nr:hypothetical protein BFW01_g11958 [Lasiodiplodia theobromae]
MSDPQPTKKCAQCGQVKKPSAFPPELKSFSLPEIYVCHKCLGGSEPISPPQNDGAQDTRSTSPHSTTTREERSEQGSSSNTAGDQDGGDDETQVCVGCEEEYPLEEFQTNGYTLLYASAGNAEEEGNSEDGWSEETITLGGTSEEEQHEYGAVDGADEAEVDGQNESPKRKLSNDYELVRSLRSGGVLKAYKDWMEKEAWSDHASSTPATSKACHPIVVPKGYEWLTDGK